MITTPRRLAKLPLLLALGIAVGCGDDDSLPTFDSGMPDAITDDGGNDAGDDAGSDAGSDGAIPLPDGGPDGGPDAGPDGGSDAGPDAGAVCGDGTMQAGEVCDDGNTMDGDGCRADCLGTEMCGDGLTDVGEDCDESGESVLCNADCSAVMCGDSIINATASEGCDDGNSMAGDGCSDMCGIEAGFGCMGMPSTCTATCGDSMVVGMEMCDDGGTMAGDGCSATCTVEMGYMCMGMPSMCVTACGDSVIAGMEMCDDGNMMAGDGCDAACMPEPGFTCMGMPSMCAGVCGDSLVVTGEDCDDGGVMTGDGCDDSCAVEDGYSCTGEPSICTTVCGDGVINGAEECDDMNADSNDGCSSACVVETGYNCTGEPSVCAGVCGDGNIVVGEQCDDGGTADGDRCDNACQLEFTVSDMEPNNAFATAQTVANGDIVVGSLPPNDFDLFEVVLATESFLVVEGYTTVDDNPALGGIDGVDCATVNGFDNDLDAHIFDAAGDPADVGTALFTDDFAGAGVCPYIGPNNDPTLLAAGTYYIRADAFTATDDIAQYALDVRVLAPLGAGDTCDPSFNLCERSLACDALTTTCVIPGPDPIDIGLWEQFSAGEFDLANTTLTFTPAGGTYGVIATAAGAFTEIVGAGTVSATTLTLTDDGNTNVTIASFPFYGTTYTDAFVGANGFVTFGAGDGDFSETAADHFDLPRISGLFDDINPAAGGTVTLDVHADRSVVTFDAVPPVGAGDPVSFQIVMFSTGVVTITYEATTSGDGLVGISSGSDLGNAPPESDFSNQTPAAPAMGDLVVNEIMPDPTPGADTNCDGTVDGTEDEFVEFVNAADRPLDLTGVTFGDTAMAIRHTFGAVILPARAAIVVYGGGAPSCGVLAEVASSGSIGLNNGGDSINLSTGDSLSYADSSDGISLTRDPDITGALVDHDGAGGSAVNFSPGFRANGRPF